MEPELSADFTLPAWLPDAVRLYLDHTGEGLSLRKLAQREGVAASTVMRQVRRYEARRDDPLVDEALAALTRPSEGRVQGARTGRIAPGKDAPDMTAPLRHTPVALDEDRIAREGLRVLRRLAEAGAVLVVSPDMERAVLLRETPEGGTVQLAVLDRAVAQAFALKDWITVRRVTGRVVSYDLTVAGRNAVRSLINANDRRRQSQHAALGLAEAVAPFDYGPAAEGEADDRLRRARSILTESPVAVLARRRDKDGRAFLEAPLVQAAERLREDYEVSLLAPRSEWDWEALVLAAERAGVSVLEHLGPVADHATLGRPAQARARVVMALRDLGPDLADVALRVCCQLEGLEGVERCMGYAARSGKIVLRIALQRLRRHFDQTYGRAGPLIG